ncbi:hypothetical protein HYFRA_00006760 [Hymenoscyphus fraxineus]|uniref:Uncharacterized protein n=1 Tax=Hymenoscyphus fraxineus TaxID=746836 RepID=A0A9N9KNM4_9HELO|nr:hypothetical protein HYFRA_00006760 [Hymenoscyphus fraxineus]
MTSDASLEGSSNANATSTLSPDIRPTLPPNVSVKDLDELYQLILQREKEPCFRLKEWYYNSPELHKPKEFYLDRHDSTENTYSCYYPDDRCWKDNSRPIFATALALEGHYKDVHHGRYRPPSCDYLGCVWAPESQFPERENCRDHYSMAHGERVVSFKSHSQEEKRQLEAERNILLDHWRCAECLHRKDELHTLATIYGEDFQREEVFDGQSPAFEI